MDQTWPELSLALLPEQLAICRLAPDAPLPSWAANGSFVSITRTAAELSIVCGQQRVPETVQAERDWCCLAVAGPLDFALTGVLVALALPLAQSGISIFALSTYDTDYLLVRAHDLDRALAALRAAGHQVQTALA